jgi:hypothetical protein
MATLNITLILMIDNHVTEVSLFAFPLHPTEAACHIDCPLLLPPTWSTAKVHDLVGVEFLYVDCIPSIYVPLYVFKKKKKNLVFCR